MAWLICSGMEFRSGVQWWGDRAARKVLHEGLDLGFFRDTEGAVNHLDDSFRVPALFDGALVHAFNDYLGMTLVFRHDGNRVNGAVLCSIFGHVEPTLGVNLQEQVAAGTPVAAIARVSERDICSHLHISLGWAVEQNIERLHNWQAISTPEYLRLIDPIDVVDHVTKVNRTLIFPAPETRG